MRHRLLAARTALGDLRFTLRLRRKELREKATMAVAWRVPDWLTYWCAVRVIAHATQGRWGDTEVPTLPAMEALRRWELDGRGTP